MSSSPPSPSFFLIGAPKCGTTALSVYLAEHPSILFSEPKEPKHFNTDFSDRHRLARSAAQYADCFRHGKGDSPAAVGEGTVWYLYSREAVPNILRSNPAARFIVMLRPPVQLVVSLHGMLLHGGLEDVDELERAWALQEARRRGESLPRLCSERKVLLYGEVAALGTQLERLLEQVERDRVCVLFLDDLRRDPAGLYARVLDFLDVEHDGRTHFHVVNPGQRLVSPRLAHLLHLGKWLKNRLGIERSLGLWRTFSPLLSAPRGRPVLDPDFHLDLHAHFLPEIEKLETLLGRDLGDWKRRPRIVADGDSS